MARRTKSKTKSKSKKSTRDTLGKPFLMRAAHMALVLGIWAFIAIGIVVAWYAAELPGLIEKPGFERKPAITLKDEDGRVIARYGELKDVNVEVKELPPHMVNAVLAIEDRRFYKHFGIDPLGIARAMFINLRAGSTVQGGSTITQQLAKNLFLSRERTLKRKIQEALLAVWLEARLTKDEILSAYLNRVYLGSGTYGIEAAAKTYFGKSARDVTLREGATLAGLLKAPSRYSPLSNPRLSRERSDTVLAAMHDAGFITEKEAGKITSATPIPPEKPSESDGDSVRYYTDWVTGDLDELIGTPTEDIVIETTFVPEIQDAAEKALTKILAEEGADKNVTQGAVMIMGRDGAVLAMVGGRDYAKSQFNRAAQAYRQPGSSFKPIVYLTALEHGYTPSTLVIDEKITTGRYRPTNFKNEYYGEVPLDIALAYSLNTVSYRLAKEIGIGYVIGTARRLGIEAKLNRDLSLALGSSGLPMIEMVTAYATIANDGYQVSPYAIRKITDKNGTLIYQRTPKLLQGGRPMFEPAIIQGLKGMMQGVTEFGTGQGARFGVPIAGKTGTSQDFRDAWFIGFSNSYIGAAWVGNDDNSSMKRVTGGSIPARVWREAMSAAHRSKGSGGYAASLASSSSDDFGGLLRRLLDAPSGQQPDQNTGQVRDGVWVPASSSSSYTPTAGLTVEANRRAGEISRNGDWKFND